MKKEVAQIWGWIQTRYKHWTNMLYCAEIQKTKYMVKNFRLKVWKTCVQESKRLSVKSNQHLQIILYSTGHVTLLQEVCWLSPVAFTAALATMMLLWRALLLVMFVGFMWDSPIENKWHKHINIHLLDKNLHWTKWSSLTLF